MKTDNVRLWSRLIGGIFLRNSPSYLIFFVTSRCNCRCPICFNWRNIEGENLKKTELNIDEIRKVAASLNPLPQLLLSGGEPFLRDDIVDIVDTFYHLAGTCQISIPTNGTLPEQIAESVEHIIRKCPHVFLNVNISLDGIGSDHDRLRGVDGCFGKLQKTYSLLAKLKKRFSKLSVNFLTTVMRSNVDKIDEIVRYVSKQFDVNYHSLTPVRGDLDERIEIEKDYSVLESYMNTYYKNRQAVKSMPFGNLLASNIFCLIHRLLSETQRQKRRCFNCLAGMKMVVLTHKGELFPCEPLWLEQGPRRGRKPEDYLMANLQDFDFDVRSALKSQKAIDVKYEVRRSKCYCQYTCAILNSIIYSPRMYIQLLRQIILGFFSQKRARSKMKQFGEYCSRKGA